MTTIAFDGETLAADSREFNSESGIYVDNCTKITRWKNVYFASAGSSSAGLLFERWFKDQTKEKPSLNSDFETFVVRNGKCFYYDDNYISSEQKPPYAIGSGGALAMAAMYAGCDAKKAVQIAMKLDPYTGGKVKTMKVKP